MWDFISACISWKPQTYGLDLPEAMWLQRTYEHTQIRQGIPSDTADLKPLPHKSIHMQHRRVSNAFFFKGKPKRI